MNLKVNKYLFSTFNLQATSRNSLKLAFGTYTAVLFGSWFYCRYNYHKKRLQVEKLRPLVNIFKLCLSFTSYYSVSKMVIK